MSDTDRMPELPVRPRRRRGWLLWIAALLALVALFVALTIRAARPRWVTFVSKPIRANTIDGLPFGGSSGGGVAKRNAKASAVGPALALAIRIPVGWECVETPMPKTLPVSMIAVAIRRKPLTGFARFWNQKVLHLDTGSQASEQCQVTLMALGSDISPFGDPKQFFQMMQQSVQQMYSRLGTRATFRTFEHPIGPACELTAVMPGIPGRAAGRRGGQPAGPVHTTTIFMRRPPAHQFVMVNIVRYGPQIDAGRLRATWEAIVRGIRVVQK